VLVTGERCQDFDAAPALGRAFPFSAQPALGEVVELDEILAMGSTVGTVWVLQWALVLESMLVSA